MDRSQRAYECILLPLCFSAGFKPILGTYFEKKNNSSADLALSPKNVHIRYLSEAFLGQLIDVHSFIYKSDYKGFSVYQEMKRDDTILCLFNQHVNFCTASEALIRQCDNTTYNSLHTIVKNTDIVLPKWIERSIDI